MYKKIPLLIFYFTIGLNVFSQSSEFPKVMYVNSTDGLRKRAEPSLDSTRVGIFLHGERIIVFERSQTAITIDGINDHWYKVSKNNFEDKSWVFGGYLSDSLPSDAPGFIGYWNEKDNFQLEYYIFNADGSYTEGLDESPVVARGTWESKGNNIFVTIIKGTSAKMEQYENKEKEFRIDILDRDNINIVFTDNKTTRLKRNNHPYGWK